MKMKSVILSAALLGGLLSASSFANVVVALDSIPAVKEFEAPVPVKVVSPTGLVRRYQGATVTLSLTIDAAGRPHDIKLVQNKDRNLAENLLPAVAQWRFTPAMKNGAPVATKVLLPVQLVEGPIS